MEEEIVYFVFYQQYLQSYCTNAFRVDGLDVKTQAQALRNARKHIRMYLEDPEKDYIKNVTLVEMKMVGGRPSEMTILSNVEIKTQGPGTEAPDNLPNPWDPRDYGR